MSNSKPYRQLVTHATLLISLAFSASAFAQRSLSFEPYALPESGAIAIAVKKDLPSEGVYAEVNRVTNGALQRAVQTAGFKGDRGSTLNLPGLGNYSQVILVGMGTDAPSPRLMEDLGGLVAQSGLKSAAPRIDMLWPESMNTESAARMALGAELGQYTFNQYKTAKKDANELGKGSLVFRVNDADNASAAWKRNFQPVANSVRFVRDLVSEPANVIYPQSFVDRTRKAFEGIPNIRIEVIDEVEMRRLGMNSMLAVGQGSARPPRLLVVHYTGGRAGDAPLAFIGKGITFDTGGISLKPNENMWRMKYDMTGAASVTGAVLSLAQRRSPVNVVAIAALAENMPSGTASRPGDVVRTYSGKTYEIISTDAEGRMVLVDAIAWAQQTLKPRLIIDLATLTGSQVTAVGDEYAGLFSRDETLAAQLQTAGVNSGEEVWRLPLHASYAKDLESPIADLRNSGGTGSKAGAGLGAYFIGAWVDEKTPWAHLDIASMAWRDESALPTVPIGASGYGVRLLNRFVRENFENAK